MSAPDGGILLDIEGTTSSIRFVYDVLFPAARRELAAFLRESWERPEVQSACQLLAQDAGHDSLEAWCGHLAVGEQRCRVERQALQLMDQDAKSTGLKALQGLIWRRGFETGQFQAHVYDDVPPALRRWHAAGRDVRIYSSGSIAAQKLFFGHTVHGNLLPLLSGHYDTTVGAKREVSSYVRIAQDADWSPGEALFISDVVAELDAARDAGMQTALCQRPGNAAIPAGHGHAALTDFSQVWLGGSG
jgi:enolase-phosphatase E1